MSMKKYLRSVEIPDLHPGPFAVRLKYELKNDFLRKKHFSLVPVFSAGAWVVVLLVTGLFIMKPDIPSKLHYAIWKTQPLPAQTQAKNYYQPVSVSNTGIIDRENEDSLTGFGQLEEDKTYLVRKIKDANNKFIFYVSEIKTDKTPKVIY